MRLGFTTFGRRVGILLWMGRVFLSSELIPAGALEKLEFSAFNQRIDLKIAAKRPIQRWVRHSVFGGYASDKALCLNV